MNATSPPLRITGLTTDGQGVGRLADGQVVFVSDAVPGDVLELEDLVVRKRVAHARIGQILEPSVHRVTPACAHFGVCGGCTWQHIDYPAQLDAKRDIVRNALQRIGGFTLPTDVEIIASPNPYSYRARTRLLESEQHIGYRQRGSRACVAVRECPILLPAVQARWQEWRNTRPPTVDNAAETRVQPPRPREREWEIIAGSGGRAVIYPASNPSDPGSAVQLNVLGVPLRASPGSFVQANALLWDTLASAVRAQCLGSTEPASVETPRRFVELYAGIGFLTLTLATAGCSGIAMEQNSTAVADLRVNLRSAGVSDRIEVVSGVVEQRLDWRDRFAGVGLLLVDPPRIGLHAAVRNAMIEFGPERLVYVSCDPATLARDLRILCTDAYELASIRAIDMFPQTPHVEVIVRLERRRR